MGYERVIHMVVVGFVVVVVVVVIAIEWRAEWTPCLHNHHNHLY